mmetsp:Transcript_5220/g.11561  ORF Transcript_5220/g.11561 Transcript_5220/m.11561 type:complete len:248 (-) Transcript_5220:79-822(-)
MMLLRCSLFVVFTAPLLRILILFSSRCRYCSGAWTQQTAAATRTTSQQQQQLLRQQSSTGSRWPRGRTATVTNTKLLASNNGNEDDTVVALLHSHHLLNHKPDNLLLKGGKYKLRGVAFLGRPGVALCIGPPKAHARFKKALESAMPQKRFKTKELLVCGDDDDNKSDLIIDATGFTQAETLGDFRTVLASIGQEAEFFELTGITDPSSSPSSSKKNSDNGDSDDKDTNGNGRRGGGKKNKKQRKRK